MSQSTMQPGSSVVRAGGSRCAGCSRGFTLIELLTTISIAAILLAIAAPSFVQFQRNSELTSSANSFLAAVTAARAEAMKRQLTVFVVPCSTAVPACSAVGGTDWSQGWIVYADGDWNNAYTTGGTSTDVLVSQRDKLPTTVSIGLDNTGGSVQFNGAGYLLSAGGSTQPVSTLRYVQFKNATETRNVLLMPGGKLRVCKPDALVCTTTATF